MAFSGSQKTRLGSIAIPRGLTGSFASKAVSDVSTPAEKKYIGYISNQGKLLNR